MPPGEIQALAQLFPLLPPDFPPLFPFSGLPAREKRAKALQSWPMRGNMEHLFVYMTAPDRETAARIAGMLVRERLAACANILNPGLSLYWWQGRVQEAEETICVFKTTRRAFAALEARVRELHPYVTPCVVALPIELGSAPFLNWLEEETRTLPEEGKPDNLSFQE
jgi:periplasmic divalent cation tolerance protein